MSREYHEALEAAGHKLRRNDNGEVDVWVMEEDFHNGPGCELCGESWCHHCKPKARPCRKPQP